MKYTIELKYATSIVEVVEANDEGEALEKARTAAEEADMNEFTIKNEMESSILSNNR